MSARRVDLVAAGVAFFGLFSLFPGLAAIISLVGYVSDPMMIETAFENYSELLPPDVAEVISTQLDRLMEANDATLGVASLVSLGVALWSARLGVGGMARGLTAIYGLPPRGGIGAYVNALVLTVAMVGVGITALGLLVVMPLVMAVFPPGGIALAAAETLRWLLALAVVVAGLVLFYRFGPNRNGAERGPVVLWPGLITAVLLWALASVGLNLYLTHFAAFNEIYGSIGAVMVLMLWFYVAAYAVLLGGVTNAVLEKRGHPA